MSDQSQKALVLRIALFALIVPFLTALLAACQHSSPATTKASIVKLGDPAADFSLRDSQKAESDKPITLSLLVNQGPVVIVFHRGLNCPTCMQHLAEIALHNAEFKDQGIQIVGIGPDPVGAASRDAIVAYGAFPFPLLSDPDDKVAQAYGLKAPDGSMLEGTFIVDRQRRVRFARKSNEPVGEVPELLNAGKAALKAQ